MIDQLLKIASEDKSNAEKLAFIDEVLSQNFEFKDELIVEQQELLERVDEAIEKLANEPYTPSPGAVRAVEAIGSTLGRTAVGAGRGALIGQLAAGRAAKGALVGGGLSLAGDALGALAKKGLVTKQASMSAGFKQGLGLAGAGIAGMVGTALVNDMYSAAKSALTKGRNFERMIQAEPELKQYPADKVKAYFNTLHEKGGPEMSGDPVLASAFVKQQLDFHGSSIIDQVNKIVGIRSELGKSKGLGKLDFMGLTKSMGRDDSGVANTPTKPSGGYTQGY